MLASTSLDTSFRTAYAQAKELALAQARVPLVTAGSIHVEPRKEGHYVYRYRYGSSGKRVVEYLGPVGEPETDRRIERAKEEIAEHALIAQYAHNLRRLNLYAVDNSTACTVAAMSNLGIFGRGALLVGTHAFGALLNELGVIASPFPMTEDIDVARAHRIEVAAIPKGGMLALLQQTGLPFHEVPAFRRGAPATSFKVRGTRLKVDLLVPSDERPYGTIAIPELGAHATGLPHFRYLLEGHFPSMLIGRERLIPVSIPHAGRFCIHKLAVHSLRSPGDDAKRKKDLLQAALLAKVIVADQEWLLEEAIAAIPRTMRARIKLGAARAIELLAPKSPDAAAALSALVR